MRQLLAIFVVLITSGCATTPHFDKISGVTPKTIVDVIECEIIAAKQKNKMRLAREKAKRGRLPQIKRERLSQIERQIERASYAPPDLEDLIAIAELNLQVDEQAILAPTFTHTDVVSKSLTRIFDWGVKLDTQSQRVYSETVRFTIREMAPHKESCDRRPRGVSLNGTLGIEEVVDMAFGTIDPDDQGIDRPPASDGDQDGGGGKKRRGGAKAAFATSIEFSVVGAITATGPTWSLVHFKGPGKLFSTQRNDTHKVTISFARNDRDALMQIQFIKSEQLSTTIPRRTLQRLP